ncbi:MAG: hypothetical protein ACREIV_09640 [Planctomycetaceae bacterium]
MTSSVNGRTVLEAAGIAGLFDARVDGPDIEDLALPGKPAPDAFLDKEFDFSCGSTRTFNLASHK